MQEYRSRELSRKPTVCTGREKKTKFAQREASWDAAIQRRHDRVQGTNRDESRGTDGLFSRTIDIMRPAQGVLSVSPTSTNTRSPTTAKQKTPTRRPATPQLTFSTQWLLSQRRACEVLTTISFYPWREGRRRTRRDEKNRTKREKLGETSAVMVSCSYRGNFVV